MSDLHETLLEQAKASVTDMDAEVAFAVSWAGMLRREEREIAFAAEITRLRALVAAQEAEIARLRGEVAELADTAPTGLEGRGA